MPRTAHRPSTVRGLAACVFLLFAMAACAPAARADADIVQFGNSIHIAKDSTAHDVVCFFCSVHIEGAVNGDTVVFFGNVDIDGRANHDVVNFFGSVHAADNASIGQDLVNFFGSVRLGENVSVGKDMVVMFGSVQAAPLASFGGERVLFPAWIFWGPFLIIFGGVYFIVHEVRAQRRMRLMRGY